MKNWTLVILMIGLLVCSCTKMSDPKLDGYEEVESLVDKSQTNHFDESLFCNDWILSKVMAETFVDGNLTKTENITGRWDRMTLTFRKNHTMVEGNEDGEWLYSHNHLLWKTRLGYWCFEVVKVEADILCIKFEDSLGKVDITPFFVDRSGEHKFNILTFISKDSFESSL